MLENCIMCGNQLSAIYLAVADKQFNSATRAKAGAMSKSDPSLILDPQFVMEFEAHLAWMHETHSIFSDPERFVKLLKPISRPKPRKFRSDWPSKARRRAERLAVNGHVVSRNAVEASVDDAIRIMATQKDPVPIGFIVNGLIKRGHKFPSQNPNGTMGGRLRDYKNKKGLMHVRGYGWWLKARHHTTHNDKK